MKPQQRHAQKPITFAAPTVVVIGTVYENILDLDVRDDGNGQGVLVRVAGEIDITSAPSLASCLDDLLVRRRSVVVDLEAVSFMGASGVRVLIGAHHRAAMSSATLRLRRPSHPVVRVLAISGVSDLIAAE